jgi:hypothetical protein
MAGLAPRWSVQLVEVEETGGMAEARGALERLESAGLVEPAARPEARELLGQAAATGGTGFAWINGSEEK